VLRSLPPHDYKALRKLMVTAILATDSACASVLRLRLRLRRRCACAACLTRCPQ
jgi:hypothetical protein